MKTAIVYVLIAYFHAGFGSGSTGGPVMVDNIATLEACQELAKSFGDAPKWATCRAVTKVKQ
jgi:hypothetical protein